MLQRHLDFKSFFFVCFVFLVGGYKLLGERVNLSIPNKPELFVTYSLKCNQVLTLQRETNVRNNQGFPK